MRNENAHKDELAGVPLADLLSSLTQEFARASAGHHLTQEYWRKVYERIPALAEHRPTSMRIISCKLTLPVALQAVEKKDARLKPIGLKQLEEALGDEIEGERRHEVAKAVHDRLLRVGRFSFGDDRLLSEIEAAVKEELPRVKKPIRSKRFEELRLEAMAEAIEEVEARVAYRTADLATLPAESLAKLDIDLILYE